MCMGGKRRKHDDDDGPTSFLETGGSEISNL
jgi:hypothetical protein